MKVIKLQLRLWAAGKQAPADLDAILAPLAEAVECWEAVERLSAEEGQWCRVWNDRSGIDASVCCSGTWTEHKTLQFYGDTKLAALREAVAAMDKAKENKHD